ncbi:MAG: hypothetical protein JXB32_13560 [Deltaproteobacteria bacterium]|nr:hypothetical protein [Deltaproteobacteria bacterium]
MPRGMHRRLGPAALAAALAFALAAPGCGYRLVPTDRTVHLALSGEGPVHPEALPAVEQALSERLRDEGLRLATADASTELAVVVSGAGEAPALPAEDDTGRFEPAAWDLRLLARATLRRGDGTAEELGTFEASGAEATGTDAAAADRAHTSACALAARGLAARIVAALLSRL